MNPNDELWNGLERHIKATASFPLAGECITLGVKTHSPWYLSKSSEEIMS